jgi:cytochrome c biogenesis factor
VAIRSNLYEDLYIILEGWQSNGATADFKVLVNPLVIWIWIGGGVFLLGGLITFWPNRKYTRILKESGGQENSSYSGLSNISFPGLNSTSPTFIG